MQMALDLWHKEIYWPGTPRLEDVYRLKDGPERMLEMGRMPGKCGEALHYIYYRRCFYTFSIYGHLHVKHVYIPPCVDFFWSFRLCLLK